MSFFDKVRRQKLLSFSLILFTLAIGVVIGTLINTGVKAAKNGEAVAPGATPLVIPNATQLSNEFTTIAKNVEPSVVNISTEYLPKQTRQAQPRRSTPRRGTPSPDDQEGDGGMEDFFNRFFGSPFGQQGPMPEMPDRRGFALGSGVVVDRTGYILTNNHVVEKADRIRVKFAGDVREYDAKVIGTDPPTDLAVIRVEGKDTKPAKIGNSDGVQVGDWAVAIGSPFGFQASVTAGIISSKNRDIPGDSSQFQHFLQTDAAINPGNSGGPLLNIRGEVIGINTAIASRSGGYQGIGFALPMNTAVRVYNEIIKTGKVTRGGIGVQFKPSDAPGTRELLKAYGANEGIFVQDVPAGGPAAKAGIKSGDIIVAINGKPVTQGNDLIERVTTTPVGTPLDITVLREGKRMNFKVVVADLAQTFPEQFGGGPNEEAQRGDATQAKFGVSIEVLTDARRQQMGLKISGGVLVSEVIPGSFADDIGMQPRDVIVAINRQAVNNVDDVKRIQNNLKPGDAVAFQVMRSASPRGGDWASVFLAGTLPNPR